MFFAVEIFCVSYWAWRKRILFGLAAIQLLNGRNTAGEITAGDNTS